MKNITIEIINPVECKIDKKTAEIIRPILSYKSVYYQQIQYRKIRKEYLKSTLKSDSQGSFYFYKGFLDRVILALKEKSLSPSIVGEIQRVPATDPALIYKMVESKFDNFDSVQANIHIQIIREAIQKQQGIIVAPTGIGKTSIGAILLKCFSKKTKLLWLCHTKDAGQTENDFKKLNLFSIGVIEGNRKEIDKNITIATRQSFKKFIENNPEYRNYYDMLIVDECFAKGTLISTPDGKIEIEKIKKGDLVNSINGIQKVTNTFKNKIQLNQIVKLNLSNHKTIYCTRNHLFFTDKGWIKAEKLKKRNILFSLKKEKENGKKIQYPKKRKNMSHLWNKFFTSCKQILFQKLWLFKYRQKKNKFYFHENNEYKTKRNNIPTNEIEQSIKKSFNYRKRENDKKKKRNSPYFCRRKRREWKINSCPNIISKFFRVENRNSNSSWRKISWLSYLLQSRYWKQVLENSNRSRWKRAQLETKKRKRLKKRTKVEGIRVDNIEIYKPGHNDKSFSCFISDKEKNQSFTEFYDLEVENTHCYFVENVLVHNCHHVAKFDSMIKNKETEKKEKKDSEYAFILKNIHAPLRFGLTASPSNDIEGQMVSEAFLGPVIKEFTVNEGNELNLFAKPKIKFLRFEKEHKISELKNYNDVYDRSVVLSSRKHEKIIETASQHALKNESVLIFIKKIEQGLSLQKQAEKIGLKTIFLWGETDSLNRKQTRNDLNQKKELVVICSMIWTEKINIPELNVVINAMENKSVSLTKQIIGRGLRKTKDKKELIYYDIFDPSHKYLLDAFGERICIYLDNDWI